MGRLFCSYTRAGGYLSKITRALSHHIARFSPLTVTSAIMAPTVGYLFTALTSLLNNALDPSIQFSSRNEFKDVDPPFPHDTPTSELPVDDPNKQGVLPSLMEF